MSRQWTAARSPKAMSDLQALAVVGTVVVAITVTGLIFTDQVIAAALLLGCGLALALGFAVRHYCRLRAAERTEMDTVLPQQPWDEATLTAIKPVGPARVVQVDLAGNKATVWKPSPRPRTTEPWDIDQASHLAAMAQEFTDIHDDIDQAFADLKAQLAARMARVEARLGLFERVGAQHDESNTQQDEENRSDGA